MKPTTPIPSDPITAALIAAFAPLADAIATKVRQQIDAALEEHSDGARLKPAWLTEQQLCEVMQFSRATAHRHRREGMPHIMVGESVRFDLDAVKAWFVERSAARKAAADAE